MSISILVAGRSSLVLRPNQRIHQVTGTNGAMRQEMPFVGAYFFVIPGWSAGPGPEPMNTGHSRAGRGLCSWVPGSRAAPEPRNDEYFRFPDSLNAKHHVITSHRL